MFCITSTIRVIPQIAPPNSTGLIRYKIRKKESEEILKPKIAILSILLVSLIPVCNVAAQVPPIERAALIALHTATNGAGWIDDTGWDTAVLDTECTWYGVACAGGHVTELRLSSNQLSGNLPPELGNLDNLVRLELPLNQLSGSLPSEMGNLSVLTYLFLYTNQLSGSIPPELGSLDSLEQLGLNHNQLSGNIPPELENLGSLVGLYLGDNQLSGSVPPELGNLGGLTHLHLYSNQLSGSIPLELENLNALDPSGVDIGYNALWTNDVALQAFLLTKDPDWNQTQTIAPEGVTAGSATASSFVVNWTPILYSVDDGWYQIMAPQGVVFIDGFEIGDISMWGAGPGPDLPGVFMTVDKTDNSILVDGLQPDTAYHFVVQTVTEPHASNQNQVVSGLSVVVLGTTTP